MADLPPNADNLPDNLAQEIQELALAMMEGSASDEDSARMDQIICGNPAAARYLARSLQTSQHLGDLAPGVRQPAKTSPRRPVAPRAVAARSPVLGFLNSMMYVDGGFRLTSLPMIAGLAGLFLILSLVAIVPAYLSMRRAELETAQREQREEQERQLAASKAQEEKAAESKAKHASRALLDVYATLLSERNPLYTARALGDSAAWVYAHGLAQARLSFAVDCRWRGAAPDVGEALTRGRRLELKAGLAEIVFQDGARTILQGPATLEIRSGSGAYLTLGRYTVNVGDARAKGFEVATPGMKYTDLGTEFGVLVAADGEQEMHVFQGTVQAAEARSMELGAVSQKSELPAPSSPLPAPRPLLLSAHQAIRVSAPADQGKPATPIETIAADEKRFVRKMPPPPEIELADVVAGGNGFSARTDRGVNQLTGEAATVKGTLLSTTRTTRQYCKVTASKFIDGVFVPEGSAGPVQLDSAGHRYALPKTSGYTDHSIFAESVAPLGTSAAALASRGHGISLALAERVVVQHPQLYLHANVGVTFDLAALRAGRAGYRPARFQAVLCGERSSGRPPVVAAWVFVDGELRFQKPKLRPVDGLLGIDLPLAGNAKFLTLVATDADLDIHGDHVIFHSPRVVMTAATPGN